MFSRPGSGWPGFSYNRTRGPKIGPLSPAPRQHPFPRSPRPSPRPASHWVQLGPHALPGAITLTRGMLGPSDWLSLDHVPTFVVRLPVVLTPIEKVFPQRKLRDLTGGGKHHVIRVHERARPWGEYLARSKRSVSDGHRPWDTEGLRKGVCPEPMTKDCEGH